MREPVSDPFALETHESSAHAGAPVLKGADMLHALGPPLPYPTGVGPIIRAAASKGASDGAGGTKSSRAATAAARVPRVGPQCHQSRASPTMSRRFIQQHGQTRDRTPFIERHQQMRTLRSPSKTLSTAWSRRPR